MELVNEIHLYMDKDPEFVSSGPRACELFRDSIRTLILLLAPMAPHMCEEIWERLGNSESIFLQRLPEADPAWLEGDVYTLVVQVNGKVRSRIEAQQTASGEELETLALADDRIREFIEGKDIRKVIVVPGRLVNIVI
jgi:leucyl-tRNA synthetase